MILRNLLNFYIFFNFSNILNFENFGNFFVILLVSNLHLYHPQDSKISGFFSFNTSQSISTTSFEANIPGTNIIGEHGPSAKFFNLTFKEFDSD